MAKKFFAMISKSYYCTYNSAASTVQSHKVPLPLLEQFHRRVTRMTRGLEQLSYEERLRGYSDWRKEDLGEILCFPVPGEGLQKSWRETFYDGM